MNMDQKTWAAGIQHVHSESGGLLNIAIIDAADGLDLLIQSMMGNSESLVRLRVVMQISANIRHAPRAEPALCVCCPRTVTRISPKTVFGVVSPARDNPSSALGFVFCDRCVEGRDAIRAKAATALQRIWPELRAVEVTHPYGGRA